jgi:hypothetical protein
MTEFRIWILLALLLAFRNLHAEEVERDRCSCKLVMKGSESTLKGGVCVRTETASSCLMEWGNGSSTKVTLGKGLSQADAEAGFIKDTQIEIGPQGLGIVKAGLSVSILAQVPPEGYSTVPGIAESFVGAAGTALFRYSKDSLATLTNNLLKVRQKELIDALQKEGEFTFEQYSIRAHTGCLQIKDNATQVQVYVKTPFAVSEAC